VALPWESSSLASMALTGLMLAAFAWHLFQKLQKDFADLL
jgi:hypothetical protein